MGRSINTIVEYGSASPKALRSTVVVLTRAPVPW
jgi:hypothetical protein